MDRYDSAATTINRQRDMNRDWHGSINIDTESQEETRKENWSYRYEQIGIDKV